MFFPLKKKKEKKEVEVVVVFGVGGRGEGGWVALLPAGFLRVVLL